jgi:hypothetical protein
MYKNLFSPWSVDINPTGLITSKYKLVQLFWKRVFRIIESNIWEEHLSKYVDIMTKLEKEEIEIPIWLEFQWTQIDWLRITFPKVHSWLNRVSLVWDKEGYFVFETDYVEWEDFMDEKVYGVISDKIGNLLFDKYNIWVDMEMAHGWVYCWSRLQIWPPNIKVWDIEKNGSLENILNLIITDIARSIDEMSINTKLGEYED